MKGPRGPFQTSITIHVQNLVVTSSDETKVLRWDPARGIADTNFSYNLECAQKKVCRVHISIYSTDGVKVYEEWLKQLAPGSYSFTWDGRVNVVPPPPNGFNGFAEAGLYVFDVEAIGIAPGYDEDGIRSKMLRIGEHEVILPLPAVEQQPLFFPSIALPVRVLYVLRGAYPALKVRIDVYNTDFNILESINGTTITIPEDDTIDIPKDINDVRFTLRRLEINSPYPFIFVLWAWDGVPQFYKNHTVKTTFANRRQYAPPQGHFVAGGMSGLGGNMRKWFINNVLPFLHWVKRFLPDQFGRWGWRRAPISFGYWVWDGPGTQARLMHPVQEWNRDIILKRIACVEILTLIAHGNYDRMGRTLPLKGAFDLITSADILKRYSGSWTRWNPITGRKETLQGLHHLRVVLLMGCKTGGSSTGDEEEMEAMPAPGSLADTFYRLCARIVIYSTIAGWGPTLEEFVKQFYKYATVEGMTIVEAARRAREELIRKEARGLARKYQTAVAIHLIKKKGAENLYLAP